MNTSQRDISTSEVFGIYDCLAATGKDLDLHVEDRKIVIESNAGCEHSLIMEFDDKDNLSVTSHIGDNIIDHPNLKSGMTTFIANLSNKGKRIL